MDASRGVRAIAEGSFARHETFCCRYGWLKKGVDGVMEDPEKLLSFIERHDLALRGLNDRGK